MATYTPNYNLKKPATTDFYDIADHNGNMDIIDTQLKNAENHRGSTSNPHSVTKAQVGLGNVPNVATNDQTPTFSQASTLANLTSGEKLSVSLGKIMKAIADFISHKGSTSNPHSVTKSQVGLGNVDNTSDANKPISTAMQTALNGKASALTASVTVYVSTSGNDTSGTGSSSNPYKTINKALSMIPKNLNGYTATVSIANGTYNEIVAANGFIGGLLNIGVADRTITIRGFEALFSTNVVFNISNITWSSGYNGHMFSVGNNTMVRINSPLTVNGGNNSGAESGIRTLNNSTIITTQTININNMVTPCVSCSANSKIYSNNFSGSGNTDYGLYCISGGVISCSSINTSLATRGNYSTSGGRIITGGTDALMSASVE